MSAADISVLVTAVAGLISALTVYVQTRSPSKAVKAFVANEASLESAVEKKLASFLGDHSYVRITSPTAPLPASTTATPPLLPAKLG